MPQITYVQPDGERRSIPVSPGATVMLTAVANNVPGIVAECGGAAMCATCHVYVDEAWKDVVGRPHPMEEDMLAFAAAVPPTSRLSCQIRVRPELDGLVVHTPQEQG